MSVWAPYFTVLEQMTLQNDADLVREVNFVWYTLQADGTIVGALSPKALQTARDAKMRIVPSIQNGGFDRFRVERIILDPTRRQAHIADIVKLVQEIRPTGSTSTMRAWMRLTGRHLACLSRSWAARFTNRESCSPSPSMPRRTTSGSWGGTQARIGRQLGKAQRRIQDHDL